MYSIDREKPRIFKKIETPKTFYSNSEKSVQFLKQNTIANLFIEILSDLINHEQLQGCTKGQKSGGAGSNAARRRCLAAPSDLP